MSAASADTASRCSNTCLLIRACVCVCPNLLPSDTRKPLRGLKTPCDWPSSTRGRAAPSIPSFIRSFTPSFVPLVHPPAIFQIQPLIKCLSSMPFVRVLCVSSIRPSRCTIFSLFFLPSWLLLTLLVEFSHLFSAFFSKFPHLDLPGRGHVRCCLVRRTNHKIEPPLAPHHWSRDLHFTGCRQTHPLRHHRSQNSSHPVLSLITLLHLACWLREENEITHTHTQAAVRTPRPHGCISS